MQYHKERTQIVVNTGLYGGSCGSPYVNCSGKVVALLLESDHQGVNVSFMKTPHKRKVSTAKMLAEISDKVDKFADHVSDISEVHAYNRIGVVLANVPGLMELIDEENQIP